MSDSAQTDASRWRIVHSESSLGWGGQEHRVFAELKGFKDRGAWVAVLAPDHSQIFKRCTDAGIMAKHLDAKKIRYPINTFRIARWLRENKVNVVNTHSSRDGWLCSFAARRAKTPLLVRSRHIDVTYPNRFVSRHAFTTLADHVLTTSAKITGHLQETFGLANDRITTVPTGIDLQRFSPDGPKADLFPAGKGDGLPIIGMVSVLRSWKGHPYFLEAARMLKDRGVKARFVIVGEGPQQENIENKIRELDLGADTHLAGHREDVPDVLRSLAALAIPSTQHEGVPQIGLQALACKTPVAGSNAGGIPEIIKHGETGRVFAAENSEALADALEATLKENAATQKFTEAGRAMVEQKHSIDHMLDQLDAIYSRNIKA